MLLPKGAYFFRFDSIEQINLWETPFEEKVIQTTKGDMYGYSYCHTGDYSTSGFRFCEAGLASFGHMPEHYYGFGFNTSKRPLLMGDKTLHSGMIAFAKSQQEYLCHTPECFHHHYLIINEQNIEDSFPAEDVEGFKRAKSKFIRQLLASPSVSHDIIQAIQRGANYYDPEETLFTRSLAFRDYEDTLLSSLIRFTQTYKSVNVRINQRSKIVKKAIDFINSCDLATTTILDVVGQVHSSQRILELSFRETLGVSPKAYLIACRMNAIRAELLNQGQHQTIKHVAQKYGVRHMGHFNEYYKMHFGESPSETRQKNP